MNNQEPMFEYLESIAELIPISFWWLDTNGRWLGLNNTTIKSLGGTNKEDFIGKNALETYKDKAAGDSLQKTNDEVVRTGKTIQTEDAVVDLATREAKYFLATRAPLKNQNNEIIGILGTGVEITAEKKVAAAQKEAERLKAENETQKLESEKQKLLAIIEEQEKFRKIVDQVSHDIGSPLFAISVMTQSCDDLPEKTRNVLRQAADRIRSIAGHLLSHYKPNDNINNAKYHIIEPVLISTEILEIISEKKYEYNNCKIDFSYNFTQASTYAFINTSSISFKRMLSNIINNAVDAIDQSGKVIITLQTILDNKELQLIIEDNGIGISEQTKDKLLNNLFVTSTKLTGHGIGFEQIRETLAKSNGRLDIESEVGIGTKIILTFPIVKSPAWVTQAIDLSNVNTVVILDDDQSIHGAWDLRLGQVAPNLQLKHFELGRQAIEFLNNLSTTEKSRIILLTDYELLNQGLNGLDVIADTKLERSILVTSHFNKPDIQAQAAITNTKILPKQLVPEIMVTVKSAKLFE